MKGVNGSGMIETSLIKKISIAQESTWKNKIFITLDIDWAPDFILEDTLEIFKQYENVEVTFFVTHKTPLLESMEKNEKFDLGIHPNFNPLLNGDFVYGDSAEKVIDYYLSLVPNAVCVRSHSLCQSSVIVNLFSKKLLKFDCNHFIPFESGCSLKPWLHWDKQMIKVPHCWEDDIHSFMTATWDVNEFLSRDSLMVFDFHPIHLYLNTDCMEKFQEAKLHLRDKANLDRYKNKDSRGSRTFLLDLLEIISIN